MSQSETDPKGSLTPPLQPLPFRNFDVPGLKESLLPTLSKNPSRVTLTLNRSPT